jgi:hypothetical protein
MKQNPLLNDLGYAARRVRELNTYMDSVNACTVRTNERKAELIDSAYALKSFWNLRYNELLHGKEGTE